MSRRQSEGALDRAIRAGVAVRRRIAVWRLAGGVALQVGILAMAVWVPFVWLGSPGSPLPMVLTALGMVVFAVAGLSAGRALRSRADASEIERSIGVGPGDLVVAVELRRESHGSAELAALHGVRVARALSSVSEESWLPHRRGRLAHLRRGVSVSLVVFVALTAAGSGLHRPSLNALYRVLTRPWTVAFPPPPPPMSVWPRGAEVVRGSLLRVRVTGTGRSHLTLAWSPAGEPVHRVTVDAAYGGAELDIGPIEALTLYWAEDAWGQVSDTFHVTALDPLTLVDLRLTLSYPPWLHKPEERMTGIPGTLVVPSGTELLLRGEANYDLRGASVLVVSPELVDTVALAVSARGVQGRYTARRSGRLEWRLEPQGRVPAVAVPPAFELHVTPDADPLVAIPRPGRDVIAGPGSTVQVVIDARDDHGVESVTLLSWRETPAGRKLPPVATRVDEGRSAPQVVARVTLDPNSIGGLPEEVIAYYAVARDANPGNRPAVSDTFRVRLASLAEENFMTSARIERMVEGARGLKERTGRLAEEARSAARKAGADAAVSRRGADQAGSADYGSTENARAVMSEARALQRDLDSAIAEARRQRLSLESGAVPAASLTADVSRLEDLYREIAGSDLGRRIAELEVALRSLDRRDMQKALAGMGREASRIARSLDQAEGLLERAAIEQALKTVHQRAADAADRQADLETRESADSTRVREQRRLVDEVRSLSADVGVLEERLQRGGEYEARRLVEGARSDLEQGAVWMTEETGGRPSEGRNAPVTIHDAGANAGGGAASLERAEGQLAEAAESLRRGWRAEALKAVDRAVQEALDLASEQTDVLRSLQRDESAAGLAAQQEAVRRGLDNLAQSLAEAGRMTALVDRRTGAAAARAADSMEELAGSLSGGPDHRAAAQHGAEEAVRSLGELARGLMTSRRAIEDAASGTGLDEVLERLSQLGRRQSRLNGETGELLLSRPGAGGSDRLRQLAERQAGVSRDLADLAARPASDQLAAHPGELALEAEEISRGLASDHLTDEVLARQERLFRRLLDAGRLLRRYEEDSDRRESTTARPQAGLVRIESRVDSSGPRFTYPSDEDLRGLSAAQRRMVYEYFDLLNDRLASGREDP